jgi:hypothetical protein
MKLTASQQALKLGFEALSPHSLSTQIAALYAPEARFRDPFNDIRGQEAITQIYAHMFESLEEARFEVTEILGDSQVFYLRWDFIFRHASMPQAVRVDGVTRMTLNDAGLIDEHLDFWDAGSGLLSHLPIVGWWMRKLYAKLALKS